MNPFFRKDSLPVNFGTGFADDAHLQVQIIDTAVVAKLLREAFSVFKSLGCSRKGQSATSVGPQGVENERSAASRKARIR